LASVKSLPPIGKNYPLPATPRGQFSQGVALRTGLNPWIVYAWTLQENNDSSVQRRPYNFLNLKSYDGRGGVRVGRSTNCDPATDGGCFPGFASVDQAVANTVDLIQRNFPGIRKAGGQPAGAQLSAIGHSNWGTSYSRLVATFNSILRAHMRGDNLPANVASGDVTIPLPGGGTLPAQESTPPLISGLEGISGFFTTISNAIAALFSLSLWLRVGQVVAGGALILTGAYILSRGEMPSAPSMPMVVPV
jgi:hypothetical protein